MDSNLNIYEEGRALTREEYIRLARESCKRNYAGSSIELYEDTVAEMDTSNVIESNLSMDDVNHISDIKNNSKLQITELQSKKHKEESQSKKHKGFSLRQVKSKTEEEDLNSFRFLTIRCICALMLLLSIIVIDKFQVSFFHINSNAINETITSNKGIEMLEDFFVSLTKGE